MTNFLLAAILLSAIQNSDVSSETSVPIQCEHIHVTRRVLRKRMKVEHITFTGAMGLPIATQDIIAESIKRTTFADDEKSLKEIGERFRDAWQEQGYFNVKAVPKLSRTLEDSQEEKIVALTVDIEAGNQYRLGEIEFRQFTQFSIGELRSLFSIQQGEIFNTHKIQNGIEELRKAYGAKGYINFAVVPHTTINENSAVISLTVDAQEGQQFHIGRVTVLGLNLTLAQKYLNEAHLTEGGIFDASQLGKFFESIERRLPDTASGGRYTQRIDAEQGVVDLTIDFRGCVPE